MTLHLRPPVEPMLAKAATAVPDPAKFDGGLVFEPKWDGFRMIIFRDGDQTILQGRGGDDLAYCFPEIVAPAADALPDGCVLDGELVIAHDGRLWFEELTARIRPRKEAGGRKIAELAAATPAMFVAFDLLATAERSWLADPFSTRRAELKRVIGGAGAPFHLTPATSDRATAQQWLAEFEGAGLDGVMAKPAEAPYLPGARSMIKIKHARTADVVVAGWRPFKQPGPGGSPVVGSLLLGLYDDSGRLHHIGVASAFTMDKRMELRELVRPLAVRDGETHPWREPEAGVRAPGGVSRWTGGRDLTFEALRPELVCEIGYDQLEGDRLRHVGRFLRWRPDRKPSSCRYDQLDQPDRYDVVSVLEAGRE